MQCERGHVNPGTARFCGECGGGLEHAETASLPSRRRTVLVIVGVLAGVAVLAGGLAAVLVASGVPGPEPAAVAEATPDPEPIASPTPEPVAVPDVTGLDYPDARSELQAAEFDVRREVNNGSEDQGTVIDQSIAAGDQAAPGTAITLTVSDGTQADQPTPAPSPSPTAPPSPTPSPSRAPASAPSGIYGLASGLLCRDLHDQGFSYRAAVDYWLWEGRPARMDASATGRPCTTVYPNPDVEDYWGQLAVPLLPSQMLCRDLADRGYSYAQAVEYWELQGQPSRMDATGDGTPCTTVYPSTEIEAYWRIRP